MLTYKKVILRGIGGSQAYGTAGPDSDEDRLAIYIAPVNDVLGFTDHVQSYHQTGENDLHIHELQKFLSLVLNGNPTIMELLWLPEHEIVTRTGQKLLDNRSRLMGRDKIESAYLGYATQQLKRHGQPKPEEDAEGLRKRLKHLKHCCRLLFQAESFIATGTLTVRLTEEQKYFIEGFSLLDLSEMEEAFESKVESIKAIDSPVPNSPDRGWAEIFLIETRKMSMLDIEL